MQTTDYLVIGAGIIGLTVARELQRRDTGAKVIVIDKESTCSGLIVADTPDKPHGFYPATADGFVKRRF